uniref:Uncharacterized protein n=1 Tax=Anopheles culicifacies TaxID=139723 RepID=A0A182LS83_9DIPT
MAQREGYRIARGPNCLHDVPPTSTDGDRPGVNDCPETVLIEPGCEIVNRKCKCWDRIRLCKSKSISKWDFKNMEECQLNIENLVKTELEFDEDYTAPPRISFETIVTSRGRRRKKLFQPMVQSSFIQAVAFGGRAAS